MKRQKVKKSKRLFNVGKSKYSKKLKSRQSAMRKMGYSAEYARDNTLPIVCL